MKKISIAISCRNKQIQIQQLLSSIFKEKKVDLEVLLLDYSTDRTIDVVFNKFKDKINSEELKVFSFYKIKPSVMREKAIREATGDYILFIHAQDNFCNKFLDKISNIAEAVDVEIIEFKAKYIGKTRIQSDISYKLEPNQQYNVQNNPFVLGLTSPFFYTKLFKRDFLLNNLEIFKLESYFDTYYLYILVSLAKSYYFIKTYGPNIKIQTSYSEIKTLVNQWEFILNYFKNYTNWNITKKHLEYAYSSYLVKTMIPYLNSLLIDSSEKIQKEKMLLSQLIKRFPDFKNNPLVREDPKIQKSNFVRGQIRQKGTKKKVKYSWRNKTTLILNPEDER